MANEADTNEAENSNQVGTSDDVNASDGARTDDPQAKQEAPSFGGRLLRFAGMAIIVMAILVALVFWEDLGSGPFLGLLAIVMAGAAMHYKGRKLAPGKHGASILGGILGGALGSAAFIILALFFIAMFVDGCEAFFKM